MALNRGAIGAAEGQRRAVAGRRLGRSFRRKNPRGFPTRPGARDVPRCPRPRIVGAPGPLATLVATLSGQPRHHPLHRG
jgi:hypothetical protein